MSSTIVVTQLETEQNYEFENGSDEEDEGRDAELIVYKDCSKGLGIKICGGCSVDGRESNGIFVKRTLPGGLADIEGHLQQGDQILEVNGESLEGVTNERAVSILRQASASSKVEMIITNDEQAKLEFIELLEKQNGYSFPSTPVPTDSQSKHSSRSTTPSGYGTDSFGISPEVNGVSESSNLSPRNSSGSKMSPRGPVQRLNDRDKDLVLTNGVHSSQHNGLPKAVDRKMVPKMASTPQVKGMTGTVEVSSLFGMEEPSPVHGMSAFTMPGSQIDQGNSFLNTQSGNHHSKSIGLSQSRKLSLDPHVRLKIEKLEVALRYLGLDPTEEQQKLMREQLKIDASGSVNYGDFVAVARNLFRVELGERDIGAGAMLFAARDLTDIIEPPAFNPELSIITDFGENNYEDLISLQQERNELREEVIRLKGLLEEKESSCFKAEEDLQSIRKRAQGAIEETKSLKTKVQLAEQAQRAARSMEQDYEEVVQLLEGEIAKLKAPAKGQHDLQSPSMQQKIAVLNCQLKKSEAGKKAYEVSTEKLLQFAEHVHEAMTAQGNFLGTKSQGENARGNRPPGYLGKHKKATPKTLAGEAKEVVQAVRNIIESEPLPYGWEEAYTADGMKYYINHITQVTTWSHPKSGVQQLDTIQENKSKQKALEPPKLP
ncbi:syntaxin-binding protein 4-like [Mizuhopecten yessoensis]|uniref:Syntaxin-binding protein 4 n=1 Tax=Mizuhopecten yessoensis TaxID=6573 RepID=A0A210QVU4_MIZYE|nr:syntaxin-binding protein 4-like [Mizuhopecten yessoensis]OWF52879.1 Syntaxin-binding protein 4 [Mizuhopecten yessoensis]